MSIEQESRWHTHRITREDPLPFWRHGAWFAWWRDRGVRTRHGHRRDVQLHAEWRLLRRRTHGLGAQLTIGSAGAGNDLSLSLYASVLGSLWLHIAGVVPERFKPGNYKSREIYLTLSHDSLDHARLRFALWAKEHEWTRSDPWWVRGVVVDFERALFGKAQHESTVVEQGVCVVPMPERNYEATYEITQHVNRWTERLGRFRDAQVWHRVEIEPGAPIPVPGKGGNSWDCGDDSIHSTSVAGRNVSEAIGKLVASALSTRQRHGGQHMSVPGGES